MNDQKAKEQPIEQSEGDKEFDKLKVKCSHYGHFAPVVQSVVTTPGLLFVIQTRSCTQCGGVFSNIQQIPVGAGKITLPNIVYKN